ncbi:MAG: hypothetical protein ABEJ36_03400 [Candidatus Nanosalina sp.]
MRDVPEEVVSEAVQLSGAAFSGGEDFFDDEYSGEVENYFLVQDLKSRIESALMDSGGEVPYLDELPAFRDFDYDAESVAGVFYSIEAGDGYSELTARTDLEESDLEGIIEDFGDEGLVAEDGSGFLYGGNAFPYLMVFSEAEAVLDTYEEPGVVEEEDDEIDEVEEFEEPVEQGSGLEENDGFSEDESGEKEEGEDKDLQDIMMDVVEDKDDLESTIEQEDDGGIETRDHTDSESEEGSGSNPGEDEYYEGW